MFYTECQERGYAVGKGIFHHEYLYISRIRGEILHVNEGTIGIVISCIGIGTIEIFPFYFMHIIGDGKIAIGVDVKPWYFIMQVRGKLGIKQHEIVRLRQNRGQLFPLTA